MLNHREVVFNAQQNLAPAIVPNPITIFPEATVREAIVLMGQARSSCATDSSPDFDPESAPLSSTSFVQTEARSSCVIIVDPDQNVLGILTERDVVRLCATPQSFDRMPVSQVMTAPVQTLRRTAFTDLFAAISLLQHYNIRHLPLVDDGGRLVGLLTHETLRQLLQPVDLFRLRLVGEVMTPIVITAQPTESLLAVVQRLAAHRVSCVVVVKPHPSPDLEGDIPIGIVTERDLVQFQALGLDFEGHTVAEVMSSPIVTIAENDSLVTVQHLMERYLIRRVAVTGSGGDLRGILTQSNVLQALSPVELYKLTEALETKVEQLEREKLELLQNRNQQLEAEINSRTADLQNELQQRHQIEVELRKSTQRLEEAHRIAMLGHWELDLQTNTLDWSDEIFRIFEIDPQIFGASYEAFLDLVHPDDRAMVNDAYTHHLSDRQPYQIMHRLQMADGRIKYVYEQCETTLSPEGIPLISRGTVQDITRQKKGDLKLLRTTQALEALNADLEIRVLQRTAELGEREAILADFLNNANDLIQIVNMNSGHFEFVNQAWRNVLGYTEAEISTLTIFDVLAPDYQRSYQEIRVQMGMGVVSHLEQVELVFMAKSGQAIVVEGNLNCRCKVNAQGTDQPCSIRAILRDVTAKKAGEIALQASEAKYRQIVETSHEGIWIIDADAKHQFGNETLFQMLGYNAAEMYGRPLLDFFSPELHPFIQELLERRQAGISETNEVPVQRKDGSTLWVWATASPMFDKAGIYIGAMAMLTDTTQRRQAEAERQHFLQELTAFKLGLDEAAIVAITDARGVITYTNQRFVDISGYTEAELLGQTHRLVNSGTHPPGFFQTLWSTIRRGEVWRGEICNRSKDGQLYWVDSTIVPFLNTQGQPDRYLAIRFDITQQKHAQQLLEDSQVGLKRQLLAIEAAVDGIAILQDGCYQYLNSAHVKLFGYDTAEELMGQSWQMLYAPAEIDRFEREILPYLAEHKSWTGEAIATRKDGSTFPEQLSLTISDNNLCICVCQNISDRKQAELTIRQQADREALLREITQRIRQSLDLQTTFDTACEEIRRVLQADRVAIFKFIPSAQYDDGGFMAESMIGEFPSVLDLRVHDHCFGNKYASLYTQGRLFAVDDIYTADLQPCHRDIYAQFDIRANLVIPLLCGMDLWGLLCIHQCSAPRQWQDAEILFTQQLANQLAIAIQQASLWDQTQTELLERQQAEAHIALQLRRQQALAAITQLILQQSLDLDQILETVTLQVKEVLNGDRVIIFRLYPDGRSQIVEEAVSEGLPRLRDKSWEDEVWNQDVLEHYWQGQPRIVPDVMDDIWTDCLVEYSREGQIQSKIVAPILQEMGTPEDHRWAVSERNEPDHNHKQLWGVLVIHSCRYQRVWTDTEAQLLQQIANQTAIAIQQANLFDQLQQELQERQQAQKLLMERNQELAISNIELERATRLKDEFLANMSHELRTPLNSILGMTEAMQDEVFGIINEKQLKALGTVEKSASHLLTLINDILDLAKIESGEVNLDCTYVSLEQLFSSSLAFVKQQALQKRINLDITIPRYLPDVFVDEVRMRQVLLNLLSNAVKFTREGGRVTLTASAIPQGRPQIVFPSEPQESSPEVKPSKVSPEISPEISPQSNPAKKTMEAVETMETLSSHTLRIEIRDTGIGIAPDNIPKLFKPFVQIDGALNRQQTGTGLGLALVKRLLDLHRGEITLTSELGVGSCFTIDLPYNPDVPLETVLADVPANTPDPKAAEDGAGRYSPLVLLAEDDAANIATLSCYLEAKGYTLIFANDGQQAIDLARSEHPDLILMDIQMPGMDGLEAIGLIRQIEGLRDIPIIALTALAMDGDEERCLEAGANLYLSKPVKLKQLDKMIQDILRSKPRSIPR